MPAYLVEGDINAPGATRDKTNTIVVHAASEADAQAAARATFDGDGNGYWSQATITEIVAPADFEGFRFRIQVQPDVDVQVEYTGVASDLVDEMGTAMAGVLNGTAEIAGASYDAPSNVLTVSDAGDALGDQKIIVELVAPDGQVEEEVAITDFVVSVTDQGSSGDPLTITLAADGYLPPNFADLLKAESRRTA